MSESRSRSKRVSIIFMVLLMNLSLVGCGERANEWEEKGYNRNEEFTYAFDYNYTTKNNVEYLIDSKLNDQVDKDDVVERFDEEIKKIVKYTSSGNNDLKIVVLEDTVFQNILILEDGDALYIPYNQIENGDYRDELVGVITGLHSNWKNKGIANVIFDQGKDEQQVLSNFKDGKHAELLYLSGVFFVPEWNTEEDLFVAENFLTCLADYGIDEYGYDEFCQLPTATLVNSYLTSIGINQEIDVEKSAILDKYYFMNDEYYKTKFVGDRFVYYNRKIYGDLSDTETINEFLVRTEEGHDLMYDFLEENLIEAENVMEDRDRIDVFVEYDYTDGGFYRITEDQGIFVNGGISTVFREMMLYYVSTWPNRDEDYSEKYWACEGFGGYMSGVVAADYLTDDYFSEGTKKIDYYELLKNGLSEESLKHEIAYYNWYYDKYDSLQTYEEYDVVEVIDFLAYRTEYYHDDFDGMMCGANLEDLGYEGENLDLTYTEIVSFVSYLIDQSSVDTVMKYLTEDVTFEDSFGKSYDDLRLDWEAYIAGYGE